MTTFNDDDCFALANILDDWLAWNVPGADNAADRTRYARIEALRGRLDGNEPEANPAACPVCRRVETVEEHGWVFARYRVVVDERGGLTYPEAAEMEWDLCRPYVAKPADLPSAATTLWCSECQIDWWYLPPVDTVSSGCLLRLSGSDA